MRFRFRDVEYEAPERFSFAELDHAERKSGLKIDDWSSVTEMRVGIYLALRRADLAAGRPVSSTMSWEQLGELAPDDFDIFDDPEPEPAEAGAEAAVPDDGPDPTPAAAAAASV